MMPDLGRVLIVFGVVMLVVGVAIQSGMVPRTNWFSWLGRLPLDVQLNHGGVRVLLPFGSSLLISVILSLLLHFADRR